MMSGTTTVLQICQDNLPIAFHMQHPIPNTVHRLAISFEPVKQCLPQIGVCMASASIASDGAIPRRQQI
jgi:hypothetical protein